MTAAMEAGAEGYLVKDVEPHELVMAIREANRGEVPLHPQAARVLVDS
ncbi:MAG TPA: DNA-binding response regulator, partial [Chloroflexi bacterium]|nr:DNA-binding response regulator [Chloroflexota bacterium]